MCQGRAFRHPCGSRVLPDVRPAWLPPKNEQQLACYAICQEVTQSRARTGFDLDDLALGPMASRSDRSDAVKRLLLTRLAGKAKTTMVRPLLYALAAISRLA